MAETTKRPRGFAAMDPEKRREISRAGGLAVSPGMRQFARNRQLASEAGRRGAESRNAARRAAKAEE